MKRTYRIISFILVLSLLFTSLVFTAGAEEARSSSSNNIGDYIDENVELFTPSAHYTELSDANAKATFMALQASGSLNLTKGDPTYTNQVSESVGDIKAYLVEPTDKGDFESYIMLVPTEDAIERGSMKEYSTLIENGNPVKSHLYFTTNVGEVATYSEGSPNYYIYEMDVATESGILPVFFEIILRNHNGVTTESGGSINGWGESWSPQIVSNSLYMTMTPGVFHHLTIIGDIDNNMLYVYMDDQLVAAQSNLTNTALHNAYKNSGAPIRIDGMRVQMNSSIKITKDMSFCMKRAHDRFLTGTDSENLADYLGKPTLQGWSGNRYEAHSNDQLPAIFSVNGVEYNNTVATTYALDAYGTGNVAKLLRPVYSGDITVDCDATVYTYAQDVSLVAGEHTSIAKVDGSVYKATLTKVKHSNQLVQSNSANGLLEYLKYNLEGNLISNISLSSAGATNGVNADIMLTNKGNHYMYVYDNSGAAGDYPDNTHFYMDVQMPHNSSNAIAGHDFIVFDFDIFADTELINVYNGFQPRAISNNLNLGAQRFDLTSNLDGTMTGGNYIQIESGIWNHFTFVGDISTGIAYVYINNKLVKTINNGLYYYGTDDNGNPVAVKDGNKYPLSDVTINSFRCMQVYGNGDKSGSTLTPNMSLGADNFDARFVDGDPTLVAGMETLDGWITNLYGNGYQFDALPPIATIDGVDYYDTLSISEALNDTNYTTSKKEVVFSRDFVGTVTVNCRAEVHTNGVNGTIVYSDRVHTTTSKDSFGQDVVEVYYVETVDTDAYTKEWTESVTGTFDNQKLTAADGSSVYSAIKSTTANNKYSSHTIGTNGASWIAQKLKSYTEGTNGVYTATYDENLYLFDSGAQTHTLSMASNTSVASDVTTNNAKAEASASYNLLSGYTVTTDFSCDVTSNQYYFNLEFDIAYSGTLDTSKSVSLTLTFDNTALTVELTSLLDGKAAGEFVHVAIVGTIDVVPTINRSLSVTAERSGLSYKYNTSNVNASASNTYSLQYNVYVNGTQSGNTSTTTLSAKVNSWTNATVTNAGNNIAIDNVYASTECVTKTWTYTEKIAGEADNNRTTACNNSANAVVNNKITDAELANTGTASDNSGSATLDDTMTSGEASYDESKLPSSVVTGETEEVVVEIVEKSEEVPAVNTPIASVNGVPYYADQEAELRERLANADGDTEVLEVIILREPDEAYVIGANAIVDTNGLSSNVVSYDVSKEFSTSTSGGVTTIIVIGQTTLLANLNGEDYYTTEELQTALTLAKSATLEFYSQPDTALKITCPAVITTNGLTNLYTVDEYVYMASEADGVITITKQTATPTIKLIVDGTLILDDAVSYGTDIADYLKHNGVASAAIAIDGDIYTDLTYTSSVAEYLVDGKPAGRITKDVTFSVSYSTLWEEAYIVVNNDGSIANVATYDTATLLDYLRNANTESIILGEDLTLESSHNRTLGASGDISLYLNGHTITYNAPTGSSANHMFTVGGSADYFFYGPGTIESTTMNHTQGIVFSNYGYNGTVTFKDLTINISHYLAQLRGGNVEMIGCDVNAFIPTTNGSSSNIGVKALFTLGEDYNGNYSNTDISLILSECDVDFRYYDPVNRYSSRSVDLTLIYNKIVTTASEEERCNVTVLIDNSDVNLQGSLVSSIETDGGNAPEASTLKLWINESTIFAKGITPYEIKPNTVRFYEDVRTNIKNVTAVSFVSTLIKTKSSDGLLPYLYTSHDYATVNWSNGTTEYWAGGSLPTNSNCKFDNTEIVESGNTYTFTSTASSAPFKLYANLTLADVIGFNIYIPSTTNVSAVYLDGKLVEKGVTSTGENITTVEGVGSCYFYCVALAPQEAAKQFTLLVELSDGTHVSRNISVGTYATALYNKASTSNDAAYKEKNSALLSVALDYIEQAALYSGYNVDMTEIASILNKVGKKSLTAAATTTDTSALTGYISNAQLNIDDTCAFRFKAANGINFNNISISFTVDGQEKQYTVSADGSYIELSLRAYEMAKMITITIEGSTGTYDLHTYYSQVKSSAGTSTASACRFAQALKLVESLYNYALVSDTYLNANPNE